VLERDLVHECVGVAMGELPPVAAPAQHEGVTRRFAESDPPAHSA
jgi:hypothetical protein